MADYLISDLHLEPSNAARCDAFFQFVEQRAADAERLFILGDFFDSWIGDDEDDPFFTHILQKLQQWVNDGLDIAFTQGNRDFLVGEGFTARTGVTLLPEEQVVTFGTTPVLLMHGDSLCIDDVAYMQFRAQARSAEWQQHILQQSLPQRRIIAQQLRSQSQSMNAMKAEDILDVNQGEVLAAMQRHQVTTLIHGHTHRPAIHQLELNGQPARRLVLGDWHDKGWFIRWDGKDFTLTSFELA